MNKKGFTLVELLAVLVILGLIAVITVTAVSSTLKSYKETLYQKQLKSIESATRLWLGEHMLIRPNSSTSSNTCVYGEPCEDEYSKLIITLQDLKDGGYIDKNLKNVKTKNPYSNVKIVITKDGNTETIEIIDREFFAYNVGDEVEIKVSNQETVRFYIIANSSANSTYVKAITKNSYEASTWCSNCSNNSNGPSINKTWDNATKIRYITKDEVESALNVMVNDAENQKSWIYGEYWTGTTYGSTYAYYVTTTGTFNYADINNSNITKPVRYVVEIPKSYIKY